MDYAFNLRWDELSEDLQQEKIDQYIWANMGEFKQRLTDQERDEQAADLGRALTDKEREAIAFEDDDVLEDLHIREEVDGDIAARFPMYF